MDEWFDERRNKEQEDPEKIFLHGLDRRDDGHDDRPRGELDVVADRDLLSDPDLKSDFRADRERKHPSPELARAAVDARSDVPAHPVPHPTAPPAPAPVTTDGENRPRGAASKRADLTDGPIASTLWKLAVPLAFGFIINAIYSWTDMYFVSRLGDDATAALGFADQLNFLIFTFGSGFSIGSGIVIARRMGERRERQASVIATQAFTFMALYSTAIAILLYFLIPAIFRVCGIQGQVLSLATLYMSTLLIGLPGNLLTFQANTSIRSTGNTIFPMIVLIISGVMNALVDPVLIFGLFGMPKLGIQGAAISTSLAMWVSAIISMIYLYRGKLGIRLYRPSLRFDWGVIGTIFSIGVPASLQGMAVSSSRVIIISIANVFGTAAAAAYTIGLKVDMLVFTPIFAAGIAIETLVSQNIGARRYDRVKRFRSTALRHLSGVIVAMGLGIFLLAAPLARVFTSDPAVIDLTVHYLHVAVFGYLFFVIGQTGTRSLSGAGHSLRSMMIVMTMLFLGQIPMAYALSHYTPLRETGVFLAVTLGYLIFAVAGTLAVRGERWMYKKV